jgi:hypothetical protein
MIATGGLDFATMLPGSAGVGKPCGIDDAASACKPWRTPLWNRPSQGSKRLKTSKSASAQRTPAKRTMGRAALRREDAIRLFAPGKALGHVSRAPGMRGAAAE